MSDFDRVRKQCAKRGELWEDPDFQAVQASVFYHQTPPFTFVWKRPKDICNRPVFVQDVPSVFDITPGKMGDRWLVSCLGALHLSKGLFYRVVPADQGFDDASGYCGAFRFRLWWCGEWREVLVDDRLPALPTPAGANGVGGATTLAFLHAERSDQFWPGLLEKAYAKLHGSYEALKYGTSLDGLADLTGGLTENVALRGDNAARTLQRLLSMTSIVTCTVQTQGRNQPDKLANGIHAGINYRLYAAERVDTVTGDGIQLIKLKNPLADSSAVGDEYTGPWGSADAPEWRDVSAGERDRLLARLDDGEFWMSYSEMTATFTHLEVVHLDADTARDEPSLRGKTPWQMRLYQGAWKRGVTAGGCRNNSDTFHINPQLRLTLAEDADEVILSLHQHSVAEPKVVGFTAYAVSKTSSEPLGRSFFRRNRSLTNSQYTNSRQVTLRRRLDAGAHVVLPTTFEPGQEAGFTFRVFARDAPKLRALDSRPEMLVAPPAVDPDAGLAQYEAVFLQLADEHRTVSAFELHELLDACLPNDYVKSCACLDVCRQAVAALDSTGRGRLRYDDFARLLASLKAWQAAFRAHARERSGVLRAERLRDALAALGLRVDSATLSALIARHARRDATLRFGDFVSSVLRLTHAFGIFENKDPLHTGTIELNLAEWLKSSLSC